MGKVTANYETIFIVSPKLDEEATNAVVERFKKLVDENSTIGEVDVWGRRRLAYEINDEREGYYVLINFNSTPEFPAELDRIYNITDTIMRSIIICKDRD